MKRLRSNLTYANVVATLALFLVVAGGSAFAASKLAKNSVGTKQLKNSAVTTAKIKDGAVTGSKVQTATLASVPSAIEAGHATSATTAASATTASSADVAKALEPIEPVRFVGPGGEATFEHGFENFSSEFKVGYYEDHECMVHLIGHPVGPSGQSAFTLPQGFRPQQGVYDAIPIGGNTQIGAAVISVNGLVALYSSAGGSPLFGLDGVVFRAASC